MYNSLIKIYIIFIGRIHEIFMRFVFKITVIGNGGEQELIHFICPTCFKKTMIFLDDNTQVCQECGTTGFFVRNPETEKVSLK